MKRSEIIFTVILLPLDFLMLVLAGILAYFLRTNPLVAKFRPVLFYVNLPLSKFIILTLIVSLLLVLIFALIGLYKIKQKRSISEDFFKILAGVSLGVIILVFYIFLRREWFNSRFLILAGWVLAVVLVTFGRYLVSKLQVYLIKRYKFGTQKLIIIGNDNTSIKIKNDIENKPELGYQLISSINNPDLSIIKNLLKNPGVDEIILADPNWEKEKILELIDFCSEHHISFKFVPNIFHTLSVNTSIETIGSIPLIELKRTPLDGWWKVIKRCIDIIVSGLGLIILFPLFLIIAFAIKWDSEGPVLVKLKRVSRGKEFLLYKFRSMIKDADNLKKFLWMYNERADGPLFKMRDDPRITKVGRFLRRHRLDEFPQLINVFKGEMSLVGPRPHEPNEIEKYQKHHKKVLAIKPGITGLSQISGASSLPFEQEVKLDTYYIENWSIILDLKILLKTLSMFWRDKSAC